MTQTKSIERVAIEKTMKDLRSALDKKELDEADRLALKNKLDVLDYVLWHADWLKEQQDAVPLG